MEYDIKVLVKRFLGLYDNNFNYIKEIHKISDENEINTIEEIEEIINGVIQDEDIKFEFENLFLKNREETMIFLLEAAGIDFARNSNQWDRIEDQGIEK